MFDVDDPFDQIHGPDAVNNPGPASVIANVNLIDNDQIGGDNRGTTTGLGDSSAVTDANGEARITITVSMQPGDNYRAAASVISEAVQTQIDQTNADALSATQVTNTDDTQYWTVHRGDNGPNYSFYQVPTVWSPMLTVWRKLWIERDTMAAPTASQLSTTASMVSVTANSPSSGLSTVLRAFAGINKDADNYEEGTLVFHECQSNEDTFRVLQSFAGDPLAGTSDVLIIAGVVSACAAPLSGTDLVDDDDPSALGSSLAPRLPDGGALLIDAYAQAFIRPEYAPAEYQSIVPFDEYLGYLSILSGVSWNNGHTLPSSIDYWSCLVVGAWEGGNDEFEIFNNGDGDPDNCFSSPPPRRFPAVRKRRSRAFAVHLQMRPSCFSGNRGQRWLYQRHR